MHPAMAVWIWTMAMARAWQTSPFDPMGLGSNELPEKENSRRPIATEPNLVLANVYLRSEIPESPLPESLLDRLAELYWVERDSELAI
jgi:hypothetical protein